jgi:MoaA/NifB/PqqE/SkfB family radical SAM enzyme
LWWRDLDASLEELDVDAQTLAQLRGIGYGDLVRASWSRLTEVRRQFQAADLTGEVPPHFPAHVQIQTIAGCNAACPMCPMSDRKVRRRQKGRMAPELFRKIVREAAQHEDCAVISPYLQNEPLLDGDLAEHVRSIKELSDGRLSARIVSNGYLLDARKLDELIDAGIDVISISLNAHSQEVYRKVMGGLDFDVTVRNLERLLEARDRGIMVIVTFMITSDNEHEIEQAVQFWTERGVLCGAYGIGTMTGNVPNFDRIKSTQFQERPLECFVPLEATTILANGDLLLCCSDWARASVYGNVVRESIQDIWHSPALSAIRRDAIHETFNHSICKRCLGQTKSPFNLIFEGAGG